MNDKKALEEFIQIILSLKTQEDLRDFLYGILTPKELLDIPKRLEIVKKLKQGVSQHNIADKLHVGVATVTRGSKELQKGRFQNI